MTGKQDRAANAVLGIDVGGSSFITGVAGPNGDIVSRQRYMWKAYDAQAVMEELGKAIGYVLRNFRALGIPAVGLALPGRVDAAKGLWVNSANGAISGLPVAQMLSQQFGLPVFIDNGARAAAGAERAYGVCRDVDDFIYLDVSHTVSGAIFRDGVALAGNADLDGDIGHFTVEEKDGRVCPCGKQDCLSAYAGGTGLVRTYLEQGGAEQIDGKPPNGQLITQLADAGDETAKRTFELEGQYLGRGAAMACRDGKPQKVVVGGGLTPAFAHFGGAMAQTLRQQGCGDIAVEATGLSFDGRLLGAAAMALAGLKSPGPG